MWLYKYSEFRLTLQYQLIAAGSVFAYWGLLPWERHQAKVHSWESRAWENPTFLPGPHATLCGCCRLGSSIIVTRAVACSKVRRPCYLEIVFLFIHIKLAQNDADMWPPMLSWPRQKSLFFFLRTKRKKVIFRNSKKKNVSCHKLIYTSWKLEKNSQEEFPAGWRDS